MRINILYEKPMNKSLSPDYLKRKIHKHLLNVGFVKNGKSYVINGELSKQRIRDLHAIHRSEAQEKMRWVLDKYGDLFEDSIADGEDLDPRAIDPELIEIKGGTRESYLFRMATMLWSIPVSQGFGRRMRFLIRDRQNGCIIGIFALGDPVFNLNARDSWIGWNHIDRAQHLINVMDAYVVGAIPPYSKILSGKLIASLMTSNEVRIAYKNKYSERQGIISHKKQSSNLALITTTSALGRSSLYNRLKVPDGSTFHRIGYTKGFGHFHLSGQIFEDMKDHLASIGHPYAVAHEFGSGPNWRLRVVRAALKDLGINSSGVVKHGIKREIYAAPLANNFREVLLGKDAEVDEINKSFCDISDWCLNRWVIPRSERDTSYKEFRKEIVIKRLRNGGPGPTW